MIEINDTDLPITVAAKIITGTIGSETSDNHEDRQSQDPRCYAEDMFDLKEIKEIANYLLTYYESHKDGD